MQNNNEGDPAGPLIAALDTATDHIARNGAAIALADSGHPGPQSSAAVIASILSPASQGHRGSLVYALSQMHAMRACVDLELVTRILLASLHTDSEACEECLLIMENEDTELDLHDAQACMNRLEAALQGQQGVVHERLGRACAALLARMAVPTHTA